jgi:hypothetical protein
MAGIYRERQLEQTVFYGVFFYYFERFPENRRTVSRRRRGTPNGSRWDGEFIDLVILKVIIYFRMLPGVNWEKL